MVHTCAWYGSYIYDVRRRKGSFLSHVGMQARRHACCLQWKKVWGQRHLAADLRASAADNKLAGGRLQPLARGSCHVDSGRKPVDIGIDEVGAHHGCDDAL